MTLRLLSMLLVLGLPCFGQRPSVVIETELGVIEMACLGDQPDLDFGGKRHPDGQGFAAFGRVVKGMEIVRKIQARPAKNQVLDPPVKILRVRRLELPAPGHGRKTAPAK